MIADRPSAPFGAAPPPAAPSLGTAPPPAAPQPEVSPPATPPLAELPATTAAVLELLERQEATLKSLQTAAKARRAALLAADAPRLEGALQEQRRLLGRLEGDELARLEALRPLAAHLGLAPEALTVSRLSELAGAEAPGAGAALRAARERLLALTATLAEEGRRDARLSAACLESATGSVRHLLHTAQADPRYARDGQHLRPQCPPRLADRRA